MRSELFELFGRCKCVYSVGIERAVWWFKACTKRNRENMFSHYRERNTKAHTTADPNPTEKAIQRAIP